MNFAQIEEEIKQSEKHLDTTGNRNTHIENYLVRYLLIRICSEYEARIKLLVQIRCSRMSDRHLSSFANVAARLAAQHFKISDITGLLGRFGDDYKQSFRDKVHSQLCHVAWDNIYINRHSVAHGNGMVMMTFNELKAAYRNSATVIDEIAASLCLSTDEIKSLK